MAQTGEFASLAQAAAEELQRNVLAAEKGAAELLQALVGARRVSLYGVGREGLAIKAFAMRLFHMGRKASMVGEMTAAPVGPGDLLIASAGPGYFSTVAALSRQARQAGAAVVILTSQHPDAVQQQLGAHMAIQLPATCLPPSEEGAAAGGGSVPGAPHSPLLLGSSYELALHLFFDLVCVLLHRRLGLSAEDIVSRHTNLE